MANVSAHNKNLVWDCYATPQVKVRSLGEIIGVIKIKLLLSLLMFICFSVSSAEFDPNTVRFGKLKLGSESVEVHSLLPNCNFSKGEKTEWGADGLFHQNWNSPKCGVEFDMVSDTNKSEQSIASITVSRPSTLKTDKGISIGSKASRVATAYQAYVNSDESTPNQVIVVGSIYGGIQFSLENDTVSSIFVGASAE